MSKAIHCGLWPVLPAAWEQRVGERWKWDSGDLSLLPRAATSWHCDLRQVTSFLSFPICKIGIMIILAQDHWILSKWKYLWKYFIRFRSTCANGSCCYFKIFYWLQFNVLTKTAVSRIRLPITRCESPLTSLSFSFLLCE